MRKNYENFEDGISDNYIEVKNVPQTKKGKEGKPHMSTTLYKWLKRAERGTSGDMVFDILHDWKHEREQMGLLVEQIRTNTLLLKTLLVEPTKNEQP